MKRFVAAVAVLLVGCSPIRHTFVVETANAESPVSSAMVSICDGPEVALERSGTRFSGIVANRCEGSGQVRLLHADGTTTICLVGYVTTIEDTWPFEVRGRSCHDTLRQATRG
jgi:hypothetical protein